MRSLLKRTPRGMLLCKLLFVLICVAYCLDGRHPPARAQDVPPPSTPAADIYGLEIRTNIQQTRMDAMAEGLAEIKADAKLNSVAISANTNAISGMQGENRVIFGILGLLMAGSITLHVRAKWQP
jgi:hypothetical protein